MSSWTHSTYYRCSQDCEQTGCKGHHLELTHISTSSQFAYTLDGERILLGDIALLDAIRNLANR